jgi:tetratricopeptide (TPR) repeat protein
MRILALLLVVAAVQETPPPTPLALGRAKFDEARKAQKAGGDFETPGKAAIAAFDEAVKADATSVEARAGRGDVRAALAAWRFPSGDFTKQADLQAAIADYDAALELDPKRPETYAGRGFARFKLSVARIFARGSIDEIFKTGFEDLGRAIELRPGDASLFILRGDAYQEKAVYSRYRADPHRPPAEAALADYKEAARLDPASAPGLESRIAASRKLADSPVAVEDKGPSIAWSKTWELAQREARVRQVPIFFYVSGGAG